jgi:hypothetical protein
MNPAILARLTGFIYVVLIVSGIFGIAHVPASLIVWDDPAATVANIKNSESLFRLGIASQMLCFISFILLSLFLYKLLGHASSAAGILILAFALIGVPVLLMSSVYHVNVLHLIGDSAYLQGANSEVIQLQVMQSLAASNSCATITNIFAGLWLAPFGYLVIKSKLIPSVLGYLLIIGCVGYLWEFFPGFVLMISNPWYVSLAGNLGVFLVALWLLVMGVRSKSVG